MRQTAFNGKLDKLLNDNCSDALYDAIKWADEQKEDVSPFDKEGFIDSYFAEAQNKISEADELLEQGKKDNANGDAFGLVTVIYSVVLFRIRYSRIVQEYSKPYVYIDSCDSCICICDNLYVYNTDADRLFNGKFLQTLIYFY